MKMRVYAGNHRDWQGLRTPIVVESNLDWALPYWTRRKQSNPKLFWEIS